MNNNCYSHPYVPRANTGGNFCGHDPAKPRFTLAHPVKVGKTGIPRVLSLCMERITQYYEKPQRLLPSLNLANGSNRQQRTERRESCICLMAAILKYTDLTSLRVGIPTANGFKSLTIEFLARQTGLTLKRIERAIKDLKAAGLLTVSQPRQLLENGKWVGLAAVKAVNHQLFHVFGLGSMLKAERDKAVKRLRRKAKLWQRAEEEKARQPGTRTGRARLSMFLNAIGKSQGKGKPAAAPGTPNIDDTLHRKKIMQLVLHFKSENPSWSSGQCHEAAESALTGATESKAG